jgi:tetratricopeptide (TPR) repeat protein
MSQDLDDGFKYDVFISYSHTDRAWVRGELLPRLEAAGLKVLIDFRDFEPGAPSVQEMRRGVATSHKTLLVLTPAYLESAWTSFESLLLQTLDPANRDRRLIPLLRARCDLPLEISYLTYVNFVDPEDWEIAWTQLLTALGAPPVQEAPEAPAREAWYLAHPYPMPPNFTGRAAERGMLSGWLGADPDHPLLVIRALGGFGKSALGWHWLLHDVDPARWPRVVWWSFYEGDASFESFLRETLDYLGSGATHRGGASHLSPRQQVDVLLRLLHQPGILLVLDGFERALRAYSSLSAAYQGDEVGQVSNLSYRDCVCPIAEHVLRCVAVLPGIGSKVLMTTRLRPRILEASGGDLLQGCCEEELIQMQPADAVAFFRAQGLRGARAEIERACAPYGYHPLSLRLLAGLVARDPQQPGDIRAARRLDVSGDLVQRRHHVLQQAYGNLPSKRQALLSRIACFRGPVGYEALRAVAEQTLGVSETPRVLVDLDASLRDLVARGVLHHDHKTRRYDLHPIVRRYAYDQLGAAGREDAHSHLRDYFAAVPEPDQVRALNDLAPVIELYHHTVRAGQYDAACDLFYDRITKATYFQFGAYQLRIELLRALFPDGEDQPPRLKEEGDQAWTLNELANSYSLSGQPRRAVPLFERNAKYDEKHGRKQHLAVGLGNLANRYRDLGELKAAEANLRRRIALCREIEDEFNEAVGHRELGRLLAYRGAWEESEEELAATLSLSENQAAVQSQCVVWAYQALCALLLARWSVTATNSQSPIPNISSALSAARRALELADEWQRQVGRPNARDYVRAHWLLGAAHRADGDFAAADRHLTEALTRCRSINLVDHEAYILLDLARLRAAAGSFDAAQDAPSDSAQDARPRKPNARPRKPSSSRSVAATSSREPTSTSSWGR